MANDIPPYVSVDWIARRLEVSPATVRRWVQSDLMPKPACTRSTYRWRLRDLIRWRPGLADDANSDSNPT